MIGSFNFSYLGEFSYPLDSLTTYRLSINSSIHNAFELLDQDKTNPILFPNREFLNKKILDEVNENPEVKLKRIQNLSEIYNIDLIESEIIGKNIHNSFLYYKLIHKKIWNYLLYSFLVVVFFIQIFRFKFNNIMLITIYLGLASYEYTPYLSLLLVLIASLITLELYESLKRELIKN